MKDIKLKIVISNGDYELVDCETGATLRGIRSTDIRFRLNEAASAKVDLLLHNEKGEKYIPSREIDLERNEIKDMAKKAWNAGREFDYRKNGDPDDGFIQFCKLEGLK